MWEGDSQSVKWDPFGTSSTPEQVRVRLTSPLVMSNVATGAETLAQMVSQGASQMDSKIVPGLNNVAIIYAGTNDLIAGDTAQVVYDRLVVWINARKAAGYDEVVVLTMLPKGNDASYETRRQAINTLLRTNASSLGIVLADIGADATLGDYADADNLTYYQADKLHMTFAGREVAAAVVVATLATLGIT